MSSLKISRRSFGDRSVLSNLPDSMSEHFLWEDEEPGAGELTCIEAPFFPVPSDMLSQTQNWRLSREVLKYFCLHSYT